MKRILISEEERSRILGMHQEKGYKPLVEQDKVPTPDTQSNIKMQGVTNIDAFTNLGTDSRALSERLRKCGFGTFEVPKQNIPNEELKKQPLFALSNALQMLLRKAAEKGYKVDEISRMSFANLDNNFEYIKSYYYGPTKQANVNFAVPFQKLVVGQIKKQPNYQTDIKDIKDIKEWC